MGVDIPARRVHVLPRLPAEDALRAVSGRGRRRGGGGGARSQRPDCRRVAWLRYRRDVLRDGLSHRCARGHAGHLGRVQRVHWHHRAADHRQRCGALHRHHGCHAEQDGLVTGGCGRLLLPDGALGDALHGPGGVGRRHGDDAELPRVPAGGADVCRLPGHDDPEQRPVELARGGHPSCDLLRRLAHLLLRGSWQRRVPGHAGLMGIPPERRSKSTAPLAASGVTHWQLA
mmetsp:Transcript_71532/g.190242  ORF Transcript_71532/g.190242 Transcript_71532/m.190242 type:complete len:230 (-) Transcript_71532:122-811(-)